MESIIRDYTAMIVDTINASVKYRIFNNQISAPEDYNQFCASLQASISGGQDYPHHSASIITFNYDLAIDLALSQFSSAGMKPVYCLSEPEIHEPGLKLLKLHGSLNWFRSCRDNSILVCNISDYTRRTWQFPERISSSEFDFTKVMAEDLGSESTGVPFIVAPSWNKTSLSSGLSHVWKCAKDELMRADHIHIIGYSMPQTDGYFPYLYSLGTISNRPLSSITIYNPDKSPEMKSRFTNLFGAGVKSRVRFEVVKFQEALSIINKKLQMAS
jgi:hypothetical protein